MKTWNLKNEDDDVIAKDGFVLAFFCRKPSAEVIGPFRAAFELWLERTPEDAKRWYMAGETASESRSYSARALGRLRKELDPALAEKTDIRFGQLKGIESWSPEFRFEFSSSRAFDSAGIPNETSYLDLRLPTPWVEAAGPDGVAGFAREIASMLPYDSGYASWALTPGPDVAVFDYAYGGQTYGILMRHPGLDAPRAKSVAYEIGDQLPGAYWLTFVGPKALETLGGKDSLRTNLDPAISMEQVGSGIMLRAGEAPEIGDVNQGDNLPLIRSLAKTLEPALRLGDNSLNNLFYDEDHRIRWERRHLD